MTLRDTIRKAFAAAGRRLSSGDESGTSASGPLSNRSEVIAAVVGLAVGAAAAAATDPRAAAMVVAAALGYRPAVVAGRAIRRLYSRLSSGPPPSVEPVLGVVRREPDHVVVAVVLGYLIAALVLPGNGAIEAVVSQFEGLTRLSAVPGHGLWPHR